MCSEEYFFAVARQARACALARAGKGADFRMVAGQQAYSARFELAPCAIKIPTQVNAVEDLTISPLMMTKKILRQPRCKQSGD